MKRRVTRFSTFLLVVSMILLFLANAYGEFIDFRERWAILIGVGKYSDADIPPLSSPQNDVNEMKKVLIERGGFLESHITTLIDEQATYKGIKNAFKELSDKEVIQQDDFVLFYFSGRGARIADDLYPDLEDDGLDECLLPYDAKRETKENFLRDDELGQLLNTLNAKGMAIIVDSCYSLPLTPGPSPSEGRGERFEREKGISELDKGNEKQRDGITTSDYLPADTTIILEACAANEVTLDGATMQSNSLFTEKLIESLNNDDVDSNHDGVIDFDELHIHLKKILSQQTPTLIGKIAAETPIITPYVPISSEPSNAQIFLDGKDREIITPNNVILLDTQEHQLQLKKAGYHDWPKEPEEIKLKASKPGKQKEIKAQLNAIVVKGRLVDKSKKPIGGARVTLRLKAKELTTIGETTTGSDGYFSFSDWQKHPSVVGDYEISFRFKGYEQFSEIKIEKPDDVDIGTIEFLKATESHTVLWWLFIAAAIVIVVPTIYILRERAMTTDKYRSEHYPIWERQIENSLLTKGKVSLSFIEEKHQAYASNRYINLHSDFDLFYDEKEYSLKVKNLSQVEKFNNCWESAVSNLNANSEKQIESFNESSNKIIHLLCDVMGFTVDDKLERRQGQLWACMVNAPILRTRFPSRFPFICLQRREIMNEDIGNFRNILDIFGIGSRFALIIIFENTKKAQQIFQESAFRTGFDFVFLDKDNTRNILIAKEPHDALMDSILEQIDLTVVSPYTPTGPVPENMFFGREGEIKQIMSWLDSSSIAIVGERRIGKTSTLQKVHRNFLKPDSNWCPLYWDWQTVREYKDFFEQIRKDWEFEVKGDDYSPRQLYELASDFAKKQEKKIVFLIDEVDDLLWYDINHKETLFRTFRTLSQDGKCRFVFSGGRILNRQMHNPHSPLFNFCINIPLRYLDPKSAELLITEPMKIMDVEIENQQKFVKEILFISSCHPRIIQYIGDRMIFLISDEHTRRITIEHLHKVTNSLEFKSEFIETIWGQCEPLEKLITLLIMDKERGFTKSNIRVALNKVGVRVSEEDLTDAVNNLQLSTILQSKGQQFVFVPKVFPLIVKDVKIYVEQLKGEIK